MTHDTIDGFVFALMTIIVVLYGYVWLFKVIPFVRTHKQEIDVKFWSLASTRQANRQAFLESFSNANDKPWFYYLLRFYYVIPAMLILIVFLSAQ